MKQTQKRNQMETKDNLVSQSIMLVNQPVSGNMASYYPEHRYMVNAASSSSAYDYLYHSQDRAPTNYHVYYPYENDYSTSRDCTCKNVPVQETFLHQILMGKGYKNASVFLHRPVFVKQEPVYTDYGCCYGYSMGYGGYSVHH